MFLKLLEIVSVCGILVVLVTQVLIPVIQNTALFPFFSKQRKLEDELVDANQALHEKHISKQIDEVKTHE